MTDTIQSQVQDIFRSVFEDPSLEVHDAMTADDVAEWDSLLHITLITVVEKHFGVRFRNAEVARLQNVGDLFALVQKHLDKR